MCLPQGKTNMKRTSSATQAADKYGKFLISSPKFAYVFQAGKTSINPLAYYAAGTLAKRRR